MKKTSSSLRGTRVIGWHAELEITPKHEVWHLGFSKKYSLIALDHHDILNYAEWKDRTDDTGRVEYARLGREEKMPHLFLSNALVSAVNKGDGGIDKFKIEYGDDSASQELVQGARWAEKWLDYLSKTRNKGFISRDGSREISEALQPLTIARVNESYVFTIMEEQQETIVPFVALEIFEASRLRLPVAKCQDCGRFFVKSRRKRIDLCPDCPWPSVAPVESLSEDQAEERRRATLERVRLYRKKQAEEQKKEKDRLRKSLRDGLTPRYGK